MNPNEEKRIKMVKFICSTCKMFAQTEQGKEFETESLTEAFEHIMQSVNERHNIYVEYHECD